MSLKFSDKVKRAIVNTIDSEVLGTHLFSDISSDDTHLNISAFDVKNNKNYIFVITNELLSDDKIAFSFCEQTEIKASKTKTDFTELMSNRVEIIDFYEIGRKISKILNPIVVGQRAPKCVLFPNAAGC